MFMQMLIEIKSTCVTSHTFLCFLCANVTLSELRFCSPAGKFSGSRIRPVGSQEHRDKAFSKASMNGWLKSPLQLHNIHVYSLQLSSRERRKKIPSPKSWKKVQLSILHITKSDFGKLITISLQRPIRNKPLSLRHKFEFQSLQLTQLINEFLNADCARRPSAAKPLGRRH